MINKIYKIIFVGVRKNGHKGVRCLQRMTNNAVGNKRAAYINIFSLHSPLCSKSTYFSLKISSTKNTDNLSLYFSYNSSPEIRE